MLIIGKIRFHAATLVTICFVLGLCQSEVIASAEQKEDSSDITFSIKRKVIHKINPRIFGQFMERPSWGEIGVEGGLIPGTRKLQPGVSKLL